MGSTMTNARDVAVSRMCFFQGIVDVDKANVDALVKLGWALADDGDDVGRAIDTLKRALDLSPESPKANFWLAKVYFHHVIGDIERSKEFLERALCADSTYPPAASLYGYLYCELADRIESGSVACDGIDPDRAIAVIRGACKREPSWVSLPASLDFMLTRLDRIPEAIDAAREAFRLANHFFELSTSENYDEYEYGITGRWLGKESLRACRLRAARRV